MLALEEKYQKQLDLIKGDLLDSDELQAYLEEEEEEQYKLLKEQYEPRISELHLEVAQKDPLQLIAFEKELLDTAFEGLFLPRILGFSILRGEISERYKYILPQDHFKDILLSICNSANFDILRKRIGQSIQIGFALSSDIWITDLINEIENKRIRYFLQGQKLDRYRVFKERVEGYKRYQKQFKSFVYQSSIFPTTPAELKVLFSSMKEFLIHRIVTSKDNESVAANLRPFLYNETFKGTPEHHYIMMLYIGFYPQTDEEFEDLVNTFNESRYQDSETFSSRHLEYVLDMHEHPVLDLNPEAEMNLSLMTDKTIDDQITEYYKLTDMIHDNGYNTPEVQEAVKVFYYAHQGRSTVNECVRKTIYGYFQRYIENLDAKDYSSFFEITKLYSVYMQIFGNQRFNQYLKDLSMDFIRKSLTIYGNDKRAKDYQDIKKFVASKFVDFGFLTDKEVVEMFKTRRKKKKVS